MKVIVPVHASRAIARIGDALTRYAPPGVEVARPETIRKDLNRGRQLDGEANADVVVLLVNGMRDHWQAVADRCQARGQRYVVIQIALRTTRHPHTDLWRDMWLKAALVWTYYPLPQWIKEDGGAPVDFNLYNSPLGVDTTVFNLGEPRERIYTVLTSGFRRNQEGVMECDDATASVGGKVYQLGPTYKMNSPTTFGTGLTDAELADVYRQSKFVSGLRRHEGFELPAAEGVLCGARPVLYDQLHYRRWFDGLADFIPERDAASVTKDLTELFRKEPHQVTPAGWSAAAQRFDWTTICKGFWEEVIA